MFLHGWYSNKVWDGPFQYVQVIAVSKTHLRSSKLKLLYWRVRRYFPDLVFTFYTSFHAQKIPDGNIQILYLYLYILFDFICSACVFVWLYLCIYLIVFGVFVNLYLYIDLVVFAVFAQLHSIYLVVFAVFLLQYLYIYSIVFYYCICIFFIWLYLQVPQQRTCPLLSPPTIPKPVPLTQ